jgi:hypothetical protein
LTLERVKVVRNDLSDADIDIVPARSFRRPVEPVEESAKPVAPAMIVIAEQESAWSRAASQVAGLRETQAH